MRIYGGPTCSRERFALHLEHSPAKAEAAAIYDRLVQVDVDPAVALGFFHHESGCGNAGRAVTTRSWGNIRWRPVYASLPYTVRDVDGFVGYESYLAGADHFAAHLLGRDGTDEYAGLGTVEEVVPKWAPAGDGANSPAAYIAAVIAFASSLRTSTPIRVVDVRAELRRAEFSFGSFADKTKLTFHWAGPAPANGVYPPFDPLARAKTFARFHVASRGWDGLSYHFVLGDDVIYQARDLDAELAATGTAANRTSWHALFPIFEGEHPTPGMWRAAAALRARQGVPVQGHRDEGTSACPGDEIYGWIRQEDDMTPEQASAIADERIAAYAHRLHHQQLIPTVYEPLARLEAAVASLGGGRATLPLDVVTEDELAAALTRARDAFEAAIAELRHT